MSNWAIRYYDMDERDKTKAFTIGHVHILRGWLHQNGFESSLILQPMSNGKNAVLLRITLGSQPADIEAAWLNQLYRKRPSKEELANLLFARMQVA